jgi:hypothetical protein
MINAQSSVAQRYNDEHVLESYHAATTFALLQRDGCELLKGLTPEQFREARDLIIELIHGTDMALHFSAVGAFRRRVAVFDKHSKADRRLLMQTLLKAGDVAYCAKGRVLHLQWAERAVLEQLQQGLLEQAMGLSFSASPRSRISLPKGQLAHSRFIATPLWSSLGSWARAIKRPDEDDLTLHLRMLEDNATMWETAELRVQASSSPSAKPQQQLFKELFLAAIDRDKAWAGSNGTKQGVEQTDLNGMKKLTRNFIPERTPDASEADENHWY